MTLSDTEVPGFADPVSDAQATFRAVLDAIAHPGRICAAGASLVPPAPFNPATAAVALSLIDQETPVFLDTLIGAAIPWLAFHAGASTVEHPLQAAFVLASSWMDLDALNAGTHEAPEASATLILQVPALGTGRTYRLSGPGLAEPALLRVIGLPSDFADAWQRNHALFPRGVDILLCSGDRLVALPRSVCVEAV